MGTEPDEYEERVAEALRFMADDDGQLSSPPSNLWGRIERALDDGTGDEGSADAGGLVDPPVDLWDRIAEEVRTDGGTPGRTAPARRRTPLLLVAAAVVLVVVVAAGVLVVSRRSAAPTSQLVATASLSGAGLDPGGDSTGTAELLEGSSGWKVAIQVADLPDPPAGSYYEAWLLGSGPGQVQSLGALKGDERFAVPDGLAIKDFPLVDVSIEPIDGNPAHSSKSVLRGELERT